MKKAEERITWGREQRLEFIEFKAYWDGKVNRADIINRFDVSKPQASADLSFYQEIAPGNLAYDSSAKCYLPAPAFRPQYLNPSADGYLVRLKGIQEGIIAADKSWVGLTPDVGLMPIPYRRVDTKILRALLAALRAKGSIRIKYHSMNEARPNPQWRRITPHAFGNDSLRWHVRSYCHIEQRFKDFILSRFLDVGEIGAPAVSEDQDTDWFTFFEVILSPNPNFTRAQQKTIERDYGMRNGSVTLKVRCALLYYLNKRLRLDVAAERDAPKETPVIVKNRKEFDLALKKYA